MVTPDQLDVDRQVWTPSHAALIRAAAQDPVVVRVLVNAAIKKALCREAGTDRTWLYKVRPWYGHAEHFHVQTACPEDSPDCSHRHRRSQTTAVPATSISGSRIDAKSAAVKTKAAADARRSARSLQADPQGAMTEAGVETISC